MRAEALSQFESGCYSTQRDGVEYEAYLADFGAAAQDFLESESIQRLFLALIGQRYRLDPEKSCYTYYFGGGHLAPHLDDITGEQAVSALTYLIVDSKADELSTEPGLDIYQRSTTKPGVRERRIPTRAASMVIGFGAETWHGRAPLCDDETIVMINGSYTRIVA